MRTLLIEDDTSVAKAIELILVNEGFEVIVTGEGENGLQLAQSGSYDIVLLDLDLPDLHGYELLRKLRLAGGTAPVLILSGSAGVNHKVLGLTNGADDYLTKPFHSEELIARVRAVVRRATGHTPSVTHVGELTINFSTKTAEVRGLRVPLTRNEFSLLELLALRKGSNVSKEMFVNHLYGGLDAPDSKVIDVYICKLRKKLIQACNGMNYIETDWGQGWSLREPAADAFAA